MTKKFKKKKKRIHLPTGLTPALRKFHVLWGNEAQAPSLLSRHSRAYARQQEEPLQ